MKNSKIPIYIYIYCIRNKKANRKKENEIDRNYLIWIAVKVIIML